MPSRVVDSDGADREKRAERATTSHLTQPFVGRDREMSVLRTALDAACANRGGILLISGEPGIGKTRTQKELATPSLGREARVFCGRCYESEGAPPFWPWTQILRSMLNELEPARLRDALGPAAADLAHLLPELRERVPSAPTPAPHDSPEARFRLYESVTTCIRLAAS